MDRHRNVQHHIPQPHCSLQACLRLRGRILRPVLARPACNAHGDQASRCSLDADLARAGGNSDEMRNGGCGCRQLMSEIAPPPMTGWRHPGEPGKFAGPRCHPAGFRGATSRQHQPGTLTALTHLKGFMEVDQSSTQKEPRALFVPPSSCLAVLVARQPGGYAKRKTSPFILDQNQTTGEGGECVSGVALTYYVFEILATIRQDKTWAGNSGTGSTHPSDAGC
jgi:hypothetical protein